ARGRAPAGSGSLIPNEQENSPRQMPGRKRSFCPSVPDRAMTGGVELLVDDRVVAEVLDPQPAVLLRRLPQQQPGLPGLAPHLAVDVALLLPFLDVGGAFLLEERPGQGAELLVLGSVQSPFHRRSPSSGNQRGCRVAAKARTSGARSAAGRASPMPAMVSGSRALRASGRSMVMMVSAP